MNRRHTMRSETTEALGRRIARDSSGSEPHLLRALEAARAVVLRAYPAPDFGLATDARRNLLQVVVRFPDGTIGYFAPGGPPRLWTYRFVTGSRPGDAELPGVQPRDIANVTTGSWEMRSNSPAPHVPPAVFENRRYGARDLEARRTGSTALTIDHELSARRVSSESSSKTMQRVPTETWVVHPHHHPYEPVLQVQLFRSGSGWWADTARFNAQDRELAERVAAVRNVAEHSGPSMLRDFEGMSFEQWLARAREGHGTRIRDDRAARNAYRNGMNPVEFAETVAGGFLFTRRGRR